MTTQISKQAHTSFSPIFSGSETKTISCTNNNSSAAKGQYIVIHYMEQHITMCAFIRAAGVNALHSATGKPLSIAEQGGGVTSWFI